MAKKIVAKAKMATGGKVVASPIGKKVGTRKMSDGAQVYTTPEFARSKSQAGDYAVAAGTSKGARRIGSAAADAFMVYGSMDKATKGQGKRAAPKRIGKPMGGK